MLLLIIVCDFACERALSHQYFEQRRTHKAGSIPAGVYGWPPSYFCMCATDTRFSSTATLTIHLSWWGNNAISYKSSFHSAIVVLEKVARVCWLIYLSKTYMVGCWNLKLSQKIYPIFISWFSLKKGHKKMFVCCYILCLEWPKLKQASQEPTHEKGLHRRWVSLTWKG